MPALRELQARFARALFEEGVGLPGLVAANIARREPFDVYQRFGIYRNNVTVTLRDALATSYPCVERLVGEAFFGRLARDFARARPPTAPTLDLFGAELPAFLEHYVPVSRIPYLPDVARLEWARIEVYRSADAPCFDFDGLAAIPGDEQAALNFVLSPAARIVSSPYPLLAIREYCLEGDGDGAPPALDADGDRVLVLRRARGVELMSLPPAEHAFLDALARGESLGSAWQEAACVDPAFDGAACLQRHVAAQTLVGWHRPLHAASHGKTTHSGG